MLLEFACIHCVDILFKTKSLETDILQAVSSLKLSYISLIRHRMTSSNFPPYWSFVGGIHQSAVDSTHQGQWCGLLMFSLICAWTNGCANNRYYVALRRHCAHYGVTVKIDNSFGFKHCARQTSSGGRINSFETIPPALKIRFYRRSIFTGLNVPSRCSMCHNLNDIH